MEYIGNKEILLIESIQAQGKQTFTFEEAQKILKLPYTNTSKVMSRLKRRKRIVSLAQGLYALWHPAERHWGLHPLPVLDSLMRYKKTPYYVALLSAADRYGAAHHKPQTLQVMVPRQLHLRNASSLGIDFHVQKHFPSQGLEQQKTPSGPVFYSSPELTALDVLGYESVCGGFGNACLVIHDLMPRLDPGRLQILSKVYPTAAPFQRLGYLVEHFDKGNKLLEMLRRIAKEKGKPLVSLSASHLKEGRVNREWHVVENAPVEVEA